MTLTQFDDREPSNQSLDDGSMDHRHDYVSPALYVYGKLDDLTEYGGAVNSDGILGSSGAP